ncbi:hypothetical protein CCR75_004647 [Bremia lactucae]|uniref:RING-type domain-containing protein n=1 Tax=Bremia lactucae TaxID=4779 RepID=A0A976FQY0_BRELC|nr:hypothetical protein CCR75_004647 [Bremia lactucae]
MTRDTTATFTRSRPLLHYKDLEISSQNRKVRYTCVHASENFLACGASNGSVFLYATSALRRSEGDRGPSKYHLVKTIALFSNDRMAITCLCICPLQKRLMVGTMRGVVYAIQLADYHKIGEKVEFSHDFHAGFPITCFLWDTRGTRLFSACNAGLVCQTVLRAGVSAIFGSADTELLLKEEMGIVQLDLVKSGQSYILLVSSQLRVLLLDLTLGDGSAVQIGTKARQGSYGACFFTSLNTEAIDPAKKREIKVFSSRPGRRVWVADPQSGSVSSTLKFLLREKPTAFLQSPECALEEGIQPRNLSINNLGRFQFLQDPPYAPQDVKDAITLLVSWNVGSSVLFFLDPFAVEIVEWHLDLGIIHDLKIVNDTMLVVLHGDEPKVSLIQSCSPGQFLQIYGADDIKRAVELAIQFGLNDATIVESLQSQWVAHLEKIDACGDYLELTSSLEALVKKTHTLREEYQLATESNIAALAETNPLQIIYKQRPQQAVATATTMKEDVAAGRHDYTETEVTMGSGSKFLESVEYFDVLAPSNHSYSKKICAPDGSVVEAKLMDIMELPRNKFVLADDIRDSYMEEILAESKQFEKMRNDEESINMNLLPVLKGKSSAAAKAFSTFIPGSNIFSHLLDTSIIKDPFGHSGAVGMFGSFPEFDNDEIVIDPDPRLFQPNFTHGRGQRDDSNGYSVLRIAMSTIGEADVSNYDAEVLLEAISMDIWDSSLKYTSNLPFLEQCNLKNNGQGSNDHMHAIPKDNKIDSYQERAKSNENRVKLRKSRQDANKNPTKLMSNSTAQSFRATVTEDDLKRRPTDRLSMSPDAKRAAQRAIQWHFGAIPSCEVKLKCIVGGRIAVSPELEPTLRRDVSELVSELLAASATAELTKNLSQRLWPASGITRVCACLASIYLLQGDMNQVQVTISAWLNCFDPTPQHEHTDGSKDSITSESQSIINKTGFVRGNALVDGDGLPLTRGDWNLVRTLVSIFFAVWAVGSRLHVHPITRSNNGDREFWRLYESEMGIKMTLEPRYKWDHIEQYLTTDLASADEAEAFVAKYGAYLNPDLAAEVCNHRQFKGALKIVLDEVVSNADMAEVCDAIVGWISEKKTEEVLLLLKERDSLCLLLHLLDILLKKCPAETIELCVRKYPVLYPWNIEHALFGIEFDWESAEINAFKILKPTTVVEMSKYFHYLVRLLEDKGDEAGKDAQIVSRCLELCFAGSAVVGDLFDNETRINRLLWVATLVRQPDIFIYDHSKCWDMFLTNNAFYALRELMLLSLQAEGDATTVQRGVSELSQLVTLIMKRNELAYFNTIFKRIAVLPHNSEECFLNTLSQVEASMAIKNSDNDLCSAVIHALLNSVTLGYGVRLLARYPMLVAAAPLQTYHTIIELHVLSERQKHELVQILEIVDTNVWTTYKESVSATSSVSFAPQLAAILQLEMDTLSPAMSQEQYETWETKCQQYNHETTLHRPSKIEKTRIDEGFVCRTTSPPRPKCDAKFRVLLDETSIACRSFEYRNSDWGGEVQLHDSTCGTCELPVIILSDDNNSLDVVLLSCGHAFHKQCLEDQACPNCLEDNLSTVGCFKV